MVDEVRQLLQQCGMSNVAIVDDAYDEQPQPGDVEEIRWSRFFDDIRETDASDLRDAYGPEEYDRQDPNQLRRDPRFVAAVWEERNRVAAAAELFAEFERLSTQRRSDLTPLQELLERSLGLTCQRIGRQYVSAIAEANIIFLDLFLGHEAENAIELAIERVRHVVSQREASPPLVILMSANPRLEELGPRVRDEAKLLGCEFRMVRKTELADNEAVLERLYDLLVTYPDSLRLRGFLQAWQTALENAKRTFLQTILTLDLADYANMHALILEAEDERVGDYVIDLYDLYLHNVVEGSEDLVRAAKALNAIEWGTYPPAQFTPSQEAVQMMDAAIFCNEVRTRTEGQIEADPKEVHLGDVFLAAVPASNVGPGPNAQSVAALGPSEGSAAAVANPRYAFVVLSQACDLKHGETDRILVLRGVVHPYAWKEHEKPKPTRTPVMRVGAEAFTVDWDPQMPETWMLDDLLAKLPSGRLRLVRRFRTPFALQLQQSFISRLGRVGTLTALPARHPAGIKVFVRNVRKELQPIAESPIESDDAVCLIGRTKKNELKEWLLLSERFLRRIKAGLKAIHSADLDPSLCKAREDLSFYRLFNRLAIDRDKQGGSKPLKGSQFDVVQIVTQSALAPGMPLDRLIVIEMVME